MNQMKLEADSEKALIEGLKGEKKHLEMNLEENIQLKEQFQKKCDQVQEMYEKLFKEAQEYKRDVVSVDEIKKDRDQRVSVLRQEIDELTGKYDKVSADHAQLKVKHSSLMEEHTRLNEDYAALGKHLHSSNDERKRAIEDLAKLQKDYRVRHESFIEKDQLMNVYKKKFEDEEKKLTDCERRADQLEIQKKALEK